MRRKYTAGYLQKLARKCAEYDDTEMVKHTTIETDYEFMRDAYERVLKLQENGYIMDFSTISTGSLHYTGAFFNQQIATVYQGTWFITYLLEQTNAATLPFEWGMVKAPHTTDGEAGDAVGAAFPMCVNSKSKNKEAAWQFYQIPLQRGRCGDYGGKRGPACSAYR